MTTYLSIQGGQLKGPLYDALGNELVGGGSGSVTNVSVVPANGISGSVANPSTTPAITLDISGLDATKIGNGSVTSAEFQYLSGVTSDIQTQLNAKQASDADLTTIAGLTATTDNFIVSVSSAWASRTPAQVKTTLSLDNVSNTSDATKNSATATLTNKRITERVITTADDATAVIDVDVTDQYQLTAMANATTISTTGTPTAGQKLIIRLLDNGTSRGLTWDSVFRAVGVTLPTATTVNKTVYIGCIYNLTDTKWDAVAVSLQA
jgi:hypothetical protein